jgi:hypothetical protein
LNLFSSELNLSYSSWGSECSAVQENTSDFQITVSHPLPPGRKILSSYRMYCRRPFRRSTWGLSLKPRDCYPTYRRLPSSARSTTSKADALKAGETPLGTRREDLQLRQGGSHPRDESTGSRSCGAGIPTTEGGHQRIGSGGKPPPSC